MATKVSMTIKTFLEVVRCLPVEHSVLLRGKHGIGKSQVVKQFAKEINHEVIDKRLAQLSEGDMVGLPVIDGNVTRFNPPDWYMYACEHPVVLFLDELNRAQTEIVNAAFQIVLDRELGGHKLHPDTRVFAAVNTGSEYMVNEMDPALLRRFWVVDLEPTAEEWVKDFARGRLDDILVDFIAANELWLDPPTNVDYSAGEVHPTRHSWERLNDALMKIARMRDPGATEILDTADTLFFPTCCGYVGTDAAIAFREYVKTVDRQVTGEEILNKYTTDPKIRARVQKLGQEKWSICIDKLGRELDKLETPDQTTQIRIDNVVAFMKDLPGELRVSLWSKLSEKGVGRAAALSPMWHACMPHLLSAFNATGTEGFNAVPDFPGAEHAKPPVGTSKPEAKKTAKKTSKK